MKSCRMCNEEKPLFEFYKNSQMKDGHINNCKACHNKRSIGWTKANKERVNANNRERAKREDVKEKRKKIYTSDVNREKQRLAVQRYRLRKPFVDIAHRAIRFALEKKEISRPSNCSACDATGKIEAHHDDYSKPMQIRWLCKGCHETWHRFNKPTYPEVLDKKTEGAQ